MSHLTHSPIVAFLYELMRDHVAADVVKDLVCRDEEADASAYRLTDDLLAKKAEDLASRLTRDG